MVEAIALRGHIGEGHRRDEAELLIVAVIIQVIVTHHEDDGADEATIIGDSNKARRLITIGLTGIVPSAAEGGVWEQRGVRSVVDGLGAVVGKGDCQESQRGAGCASLQVPSEDAKGAHRVAESEAHCIRNPIRA